LIRRIAFWGVLVLVFLASWLALTLLTVIIMVVTTAGGTASPAWVLAVLAVPLLGALLSARWFVSRDDAKTKARLESERDLRRWQERRFIHEQIDVHRAALERNVRSALVKNDYGAVVADKRIHAVSEFLASIGFVENALTAREAVEEVLADIEAVRNKRATDAFDPSSVPINGHEFEHWVAECLQRFGWVASVTPASGDQGIDVIASKDGLRLGIQCKLYSQAVGNKAIQEALAGARYYGLHRAAVLSNASYTKSAIDLAAAVDVLLISHYDLPDLDRHVFPARNAGS
jgi:restriction system protein